MESNPIRLENAVYLATGLHGAANLNHHISFPYHKIFDTMIKNPEFKDLELSEEQMLKIQGGTRWQVIYRRPDGTSGSETTEDLAGTHARLEGLGFIIVDDILDGS